MEQHVQVVHCNQSSRIDSYLWSDIFNPHSLKKDALFVPIILVPGLGWPGKMVADDWCRQMAQKDPVVRFDYRDVGCSSHCRFSKKPYQIEDLAKDLLTIMDHYAPQKCHLVSFSLGAMVAQLVASQYKDRVESLSIIMGTMDIRPLFPNHHEIRFWNMPKTELESPVQPILDHFQRFKLHTIQTKNEYVKKALSFLKILNNNQSNFDEQFWRNQLSDIYDHQPNINFCTTLIHNHFLSCLMSKRCFYESLEDLDVLIIHGKNDPLLPQTHGQKLAHLHNAELILIDAMGHLINPKEFEEILNHLKLFWYN
jgi:pimeloyl-ACP methyl ester carboxylesterase